MALELLGRMLFVSSQRKYWVLTDEPGLEECSGAFNV